MNLNEVRIIASHRAYTTVRENTKRIMTIELPTAAANMEDSFCRVVDKKEID